MGVEMKSTDFRSKDYYSNIRKAVTAGYFMQVRPVAGMQWWHATLSVTKLLCLHSITVPYAHPIAYCLDLCS